MSSSSRDEQALGAIAMRRLRTQRLAGPGFRSPADAVSALVAVQSQDYAGAKWALGQRTEGVKDSDLDRLFDDGAILRTHVMRPTWHFVTPADIAWLLHLTAPRVKAILAVYDRRLEIDPALLKRAGTVMEKALRDGNHLTRTELSARLRRARIEATGQRLGHLVMHAELDGLIASGSRKGKQFTYALLAERAPETRRLARDDALAELAMRFFTGHGPAQLVDFAWWSGLTVADGKRGVGQAGSALMSEVIDGKTYWSAGPASTTRRAHAPYVHLLPNYDELLVAYRDRSALLHPTLVTDASSLIAHVVAVDGQVRGGWRRTMDRGRLVVELGPMQPLDAVTLTALDGSAQRLSRFTGLPVTVARPHRSAWLRRRTGWD